ncbi:MAG: glutaredoxin domain-containing protein [Myxococcota bacterium]
MSRFAETRKKVLQSVLSGLNRADEIGGEVRDFITDRVLVDERYIKVRKRIAALRGNEYISRAESAAAEAQREQARAAAAPPPAASVPKRKQALGNPELPAQIYGKDSCPWTGRAIRLLEDIKVDYDYLELDEPDNEKYVNQLAAETRQNTVPFIYIRGEFVGGFNALSELQRAGKLEYLLMTPEERKKANPALAKLTITPRPNSDEVSPGETS